MAVLNMNILYATLFVVATLATMQGKAIPVKIDENQWIVDAQNSINNSLSTIKSYGVENEKVMKIANEAFNEFTKFVETEISKIIKQINHNTKLENILVLKMQLKKWIEGLDRVNKGPDPVQQTPDTAIVKFYMTIDFISKDVIGFVKDFKSESIELDQIVNQLKSLLINSVAELVKYASSVKDQVSEISKPK